MYMYIIWYYGVYTYKYKEDWKLNKPVTVLRQMLAQAGSLEKLAERTGYSANYLKNLLCGVSFMSLKCALRLAEASAGTYTVLDFYPRLLVQNKRGKAREVA